MKAKHVRLPGLAALAFVIGGAGSMNLAPAAATAVGGDDGQRCAGLSGHAVGGARIASAKFIEAGTKLAPLNIPSASSFCQVRASISPAPTSKIEIEIWLPTRWNHKLLGLGGSGFSGGLVLAGLTFPKPVSEGFVTMATDAGHEVTEPPLWALRQPERIIDYGYRANHLGALVAKALAARYYGERAKRAYFDGCSNGGRDALMLAQRFPKDYDGIIAGAPASNLVALMANFANYRSLIEKLPPDSLTPKIPLLHEAALRACDALDGLKDGLIDNADSCHFDPAVLSCKPGQDSKSCLSAAEVATIRTLYQGSRTSDGRLVHAGQEPGSEYLWTDWWTKPKSTGGEFAPYFFGYLVYDNPNWTMASFNLDRDWAAAHKKLSGVLDATDTDLRPFVRGGGKLLIYQGWDDQAVGPDNTIAYYTAASRKLGAQEGNIRLFMVPGMGHCFDGNGFTSADFLAAMDHWVESGIGPQRIVAEKPVNYMLSLLGVPAKPLMTRPLCAWPKAARYTGKGSVKDENSFVCSRIARR